MTLGLGRSGEDTHVTVTLRSGDIIRGASNQGVANGADLAQLLEEAQAAGQGAIALQVERAGAGQRFIALPLRAA